MEDNKLFQVIVKGCPCNANEEEYSTLFSLKGKFRIIDRQNEIITDPNKSDNTIQLILQYDSELIAKESKSSIQGKKLLNSKLTAELISLQQNTQTSISKLQQYNSASQNGNNQQQSQITSNQKKSISQPRQKLNQSSNQDQNLSESQSGSQLNDNSEQYENQEENQSDNKNKFSLNSNNQIQQFQAKSTKSSPQSSQIKLKSSISPATLNETSQGNKDSISVIYNDNQYNSNVTQNQNDLNNDQSSLSREQQVENQQYFGEEKAYLPGENSQISIQPQHTKQTSLSIVKQEKSINIGSGQISNSLNINRQVITTLSQNNTAATTPTAAANTGGARVISLKKKEQGPKLIDKLIIKQKPQGNQNEFEGRQNLQPNSSENLNQPNSTLQYQGNLTNKNQTMINGSSTAGTLKPKVLKIHFRENDTSHKFTEKDEYHSGILSQQNFYKKKNELIYKRQPHVLGQVSDKNNNNSNDQPNSYGQMFLPSSQNQGYHKTSSNNNSQTNISYISSQNLQNEQQEFNSSLNQLPTIQISNQQQQIFSSNQNQPNQINRFYQKSNQYSLQNPNQNHQNHFNYYDRRRLIINNQQNPIYQTYQHEEKSYIQISSVQDNQAQKKRLHKLIHERIKLIHRRHQRESKKKYHCLHIFHRLNCHSLNGANLQQPDIQSIPEQLRKMDYLQFTKYLRYKLERASSPSIEREFFLNGNQNSNVEKVPNNFIQKPQNQNSSNSQYIQETNHIKVQKNTQHFERNQHSSYYSENQIQNQNISNVQYSDNPQNYQQERIEQKDQNIQQDQTKQFERENSSLSCSRKNYNKGSFGSSQIYNKNIQKRDNSQQRKTKNSRSRSHNSKSRSNSKLRKNNQYKNNKYYTGNPYKYNDQRKNRFSPYRNQRGKKYKNKSRSPSYEQNQQQANFYIRANQQQDGYYKKKYDDYNEDKKKDFQRYKNGRTNNNYSQNKNYQKGADSYNQSSHNNLENQDYEYLKQNSESQINKKNENQSKSPNDKNKMIKGENDDLYNIIESKYAEKFNEKENFKETLSEIESHHSSLESEEHQKAVKNDSNVNNSSQKQKNDSYDDIPDYQSDNNEN